MFSSFLKEKIRRAQIKKAENIFLRDGEQSERGGSVGVGTFVERKIKFRVTTRSARAHSFISFPFGNFGKRFEHGKIKAPSLVAPA